MVDWETAIIDRLKEYFLWPDLEGYHTTSTVVYVQWQWGLNYLKTAAHALRASASTSNCSVTRIFIVHRWSAVEASLDHLCINVLQY